MDGPDSCSMTPPLSPMDVDQYWLEDLQLGDAHPNQLPVIEESRYAAGTCFVCKGQVTPLGVAFSADGPLKTGSLESVCGTDDHVMPVLSDDFSSPTVEMFELTFATCDLDEHVNQLFQFSKQWFTRLENLSRSSDTGPLIIVLRQQLKYMLDALKYIITDASARCLQAGSHDEVISHILHELHGLLLYVGRLSELQQHLSATDHRSSTSKNGSAVFHAGLDVWWSAIEILILVEKYKPDMLLTENWCYAAGSEPCDEGVFVQVLRLLVWDVISMASHRYNQLSSADSSRVSPFPCVCVQEFVVLLIQVLDYRQTESIWISLQYAVQEFLSVPSIADDPPEIDSDVFLLKPDIQCKDPIGCCLWIIMHIAPLLACNNRGIIKQKTDVQAAYPLLIMLLKKALNEPRLDENQLRCYLRCCIKICHIWPPDGAVITPLWDHFYRKLNNNFQVAARGIEGLQSVSKSALAFLDSCKKRLETNPDNLNNESSFDLFLQVLCVQLGRGKLGVASHDWRQIRGRFYSKFHQRRLQELSETGLSNFTSLFVTLAMVTDLTDVSNKLVDFYDMLNFSALSVPRRLTLWKGAFALVHVHVERKVDSTFLTDKLASSFNVVCSEFSEPSLDTSTRHKLWLLLTFYLEATQDLMESTADLTESQSKLIGSGLSKLLPCCLHNELQTVLNILQMLLCRIRCLQGSNNQVNLSAYADAMWSSVYPFIREQATTATPSSLLADVAASFCLLAIHLPATPAIGTYATFASCFQYFAFKEEINTSVACRFLGHVMSVSTAMDQLEQDSPSQLINMWYRCSALLPSSSDDLHTLARLMVKISTVKQVFQQTNTAIPQKLEHVNVCFSQALGKLYHRTEGLMNKLALRDRVSSYFTDLAKYISPVIRSHGPPDVLNSVYAVTGQIVKYCAPLIYVKSKADCLLPTLIDRLILPHGLFNPNKPVHPVILTAIRDHLHLFVKGLSKLDYKKDPYLQRRLKDIVVQFLTRFPVKGQSSSSVPVASHVHPLVASLGGSLSKTPSPESVSIRQFILTLVVENFISPRNMVVSHNAALGLGLITEIFQRTTLTGEIARDAVTVLPVILDCLLLSDVAVVKQHTSYMLHCLLDAVKRNSQIVPILSLSSKLDEFVNKYMRFQHNGVFDVLKKIASHHNSLCIEIIPSLSVQVIAMETKRGVGADKQLRSSYVSLLQILGARGEEEATKFLDTS